MFSFGWARLGAGCWICACGFYDFVIRGLVIFGLLFGELLEMRQFV